MADLPECYRLELEMASWEADEEDRARGTTPDHRDVEELFSDSESPLDEVLLRQVAELAPSERRGLITVMLVARWWVEHEQPPEWVSRFLHYAEFEGEAEHRLRRNEDPDG